MKIQVPTDRVKYIQRKIKVAVDMSSTIDRQVNTSTQERNADD